MKKFVGWFVLLVMVAVLLPVQSLAVDNENEKSIDVKVMSYNIHHAVGQDGVLDLERIAKVIEDSGAEIIGLQEVDNHWSERSQFEDQANWLADRLNMHYTYAPNLDRDPLNPGEHRRQYGTAVLSKYPIIYSKNHPLTKIGNTEQRGLLETTINIKGHHVKVYNTHLALTPDERIIEVRELVKIANESTNPKAIMGDLNAQPHTEEMKSLYGFYKDAFADQNDAYTIPAGNPNRRIDYIFTSKEIETAHAEVIETLASDHLPIITELTLDPSIFKKGKTQEKPRIEFGLVPDAQYCDCDTSGTRYYRNSLDKLQEATQTFNEENVDFTVQTGDLIDRNTSSFDDILPIYNMIEGPKYHVLGNHDFPLTTDYITDILDMPNQYYDFKQKNFRFIVLDTNDLSLYANPKDSEKYQQSQEMYNAIKAEGASNAQTWNGGVGDEQLEWLRSVLKKSAKTNEQVIVIGHMPLYPENNHNVWNDKDVIKELEAAGNVVAYFNGHNHAGNYGFKNGIHYVNLKGMVETADTNSYSIVRVFKDHIELDGFGREPDRELYFK